MRYGIGLICTACGAVTLFQADATHPRRCARCHDVDELPPPSAPAGLPLPDPCVARTQPLPAEWLE